MSDQTVSDAPTDRISDQAVTGRPTMRMVADAAGVSAATVSYVLSGRASSRSGSASGISEATAARIRDAARSLNYQPNPAARSMRTGKSNVVLLSLTMLSDPWAQAMCSATSAEVAKDGRTAMILADGDWAQVLRKQAPDVAFIDAADESDLPTLKALASAGINLVVMSDTLQPDGFDVVRSPAVPGCRKAMEHLLESHADIACLATNASRNATGPSRYSVYLEAMEGAGLEVRQERVGFTDLHPAAAYDAALRLLSGPTRPTALYAVTDFVALSAINAAHQLRISVPGDLAIIGAGNTPDGELAHPSLSTVGPADAYGEIARLLRSRAAEKQRSADREITLDWELFVRRSSSTNS